MSKRSCPVQIQEVALLSLSTCAVGAAGRAGKGTIKVYCENVTIGEKDAQTLKGGKYVKISIRDQGVGIPEENLPKIFDPYFSTKEMGTQKGVGLGLATCHSIVEKHGGELRGFAPIGIMEYWNTGIMGFGKLG